MLLVHFFRHVSPVGFIGQSSPVRKYWQRHKFFRLDCSLLSDEDMWNIPGTTDWHFRDCTWMFNEESSEAVYDWLFVAKITGCFNLTLHLFTLCSFVSAVRGESQKTCKLFSSETFHYSALNSNSWLKMTWTKCKTLFNPESSLVKVPVKWKM